MGNVHLLLYLAAIVMAFAVDSGVAFSSGPPDSTCFSQFPKHGPDMQGTDAPYTIAFFPTDYTPGQPVTVTLSANAGATPFKGFQVIARRSVGNEEEFIGSFVANDNATGQVLDCIGKSKVMWTHNTNADKTSVSAVWTPPTDNFGELNFLLSVVEVKAKFWHKVSFPLQSASTSAVVPSATTVPTVAASNALSVNWTECGLTKGCWLVPVDGQASCTGDDCQAALSYRKQGDAFLMEMAVKGQELYVSVGFSDDKIMADDQTVSCTANPGFESVQMGYNSDGVKQFNQKQFSQGIRDLKVGQVNGQAVCTFTRDARVVSLSLDGKTPKPFDLNNEYYLFLAWGGIYPGTPALKHHDVLPAISAAKMDLTLVNPSSSASRLSSFSPLFAFLLLGVLGLFK